MITNAIITFFVGIPSFLFGLLPVSQGFPFEIKDTIANLVETAFEYNWFFPIQETLIVWGVIFGFQIAMLLFKAVMFFINFVRGRAS